MWKHFLKGIVSAFNIFGTSTIEEPKTLQDDWEAIHHDWEQILGPSEYWENEYRKLEDEEK